MTAEMASTEASVAFPQNEEELNKILREAAQEQRRVDKIEKDKKDALSRTNARFEAMASPHLARIEELMRVAVPYIKANRKKLTAGKQSFETADTIVAFRSDGKGTLEVFDEEAAVTALKKRRGGRKFIVVKETVDKVAAKKALIDKKLRAVPGLRLLYKNSLRVELKLTAAEKQRKVKPTVLIREIDE